MAQHAALVWALLLTLALSPSIAEDAAPKEEKQDTGPWLVTCGSTVKLEHAQTRHVLQSHDISYGYGRGSGQQSVTGYPDRNSAGSLWIIRSGEGYCPQGTPIKKGALVKLQHAQTRRWLHSHLFSSPLSGNQEVSCFGNDAETDTGDVWKVEWSSGDGHWLRDLAVTLKHQDTGAYLTAHNRKYNRPITGHIEVFATKHKSSQSNWATTEGLYFPQRDSAAAAT